MTNYISPKPVTISHSSTSLYPALPGFVSSCMYHCYLYRSH